MINDLAIRTALEGVLGASLDGTPVTNEDGPAPVSGAHVRTRLARTGERKLSNARTVASGVFEALCHVPVEDGYPASESLAIAVKAEFLPVDRLLDGLVLLEEVGLLTTRPGTGTNGEGGAEWVICPVQITWRAEQIGS